MQKTGASKKSAAQPLQEIIIESIKDKKGKNIVLLDLRKVEDASADYFIICHADSTPQLRAIADNVINEVKEITQEAPWHKEGYENLEWVLLDYFNIVVHVFLKEKRDFYQLEELWSDALIKEYNEAY